MYIALDDEDRTLAAWPLLRRPINDDRYDLTSVYGHVGPLTADGADAGACFDAILDTMRSEGAVSLFSRMHPVLDQRLPETWRGEPAGRVVIIDASDPASVVQSYRTDHRQGIARARGRGLTVRQRSGSDAVTLFHQIYSEAMVDLDAKEFYFFDSDYFHGLTAAQDFDVTILFAEFEGQTVSASMFITTGEIMQYYLSGTRPAYRALAAAKVLIAEAHQRAVETGVRWLVLGGGLGSREDGLFAFKRGFSGLTAPFHLTRRVLNPQVYANLCRAAGVDPEATVFFPAYRQVA
ncbi:peptidoglycan bridge formation glycyltransferase FemA/FemB family protein [Brevundimonas sp.]|uniref:peptidoglycan bridge formation glycyltransferase FemA/FemB family protein n=1 Tax=Brevundimonas sp. TaxID=1871086 RepID=UPI00391BF0F3